MGWTNVMRECFLICVCVFVLDRINRVGFWDRRWDMGVRERVIFFKMSVCVFKRIMQFIFRDGGGGISALKIE